MRATTDSRIAIATSVLAKIAAFCAVMVIPIHNDFGGRVSPLIPQTGADISFYLHAAHQMFGPGQSWLREIYEFYVIERDFSTPMLAPPLFPFLLHVTAYTSNTLALALAFLAMGIATTWIWLRWLAEQGLALPWLIVFALLPNVIWFTLSPSTDLPFALLFTVFFVSYFQNDRSDSQTFVALAAVALLVLTRSNSLSVLLFLLFDQSRSLLTAETTTVRHQKTALFCTVVITALAGIYYLPSFNGTLYTLDRLQFFGHTTDAYMAGLFPSLPSAIDGVVSWLSLVAAKVLYAVGLRPSFSGVALPFVLLRSVAGLFLLPGLIYLLLNANWRLRTFVGLFMLPILLGPAQDRYVLPLQAILFCYGVCAYRQLAIWTGQWLRPIPKKDALRK